MSKGSKEKRYFMLAVLLFVVSAFGNAAIINYLVDLGKYQVFGPIFSLAVVVAEVLFSLAFAYSCMTFGFYGEDTKGYRIIRQDELEQGKVYRRISSQRIPCLMNVSRPVGEAASVKDFPTCLTYLVSAVCPDKTVRLIALDCDPTEYFLQAIGDTRILKALKPTGEKRDGGDTLTSQGEVITDPLSDSGAAPSPSL